MRRRRQRVRQTSEPHRVWERLPWFLIMLTWWVVFAVMVTRISPDRLRDVGVAGMYLPFFGVLLITLFVTIAVIGNDIWRALVWSVVMCVFGALRVAGLGQWFNALLLIGLAGSAEYYRLSGRTPLFPVDKSSAQ